MTSDAGSVTPPVVVRPSQVRAARLEIEIRERLGRSVPPELRTIADAAEAEPGNGRNA